MKRMPRRLEGSLRKALRGYAARRRLWAVAAAVAAWAGVTGAVALAGMGLDRLVDVPGWARLPFTAAAAVAGVALGIRWILILLWPRSVDAVAAALDAASGDARGSLRSQVDFAGRKDGAGPFEALSRERALALWAGRSGARYAAAGRTWRLLAGVAALAAVAGGLACVPSVRAPLLWQRFVDPLGNYERPSAAWLEVEAPSKVDGGDAFVVRARWRGAAPYSQRPVVRFFREDGTTMVRLMSMEGERPREPGDVRPPGEIMEGERPREPLPWVVEVADVQQPFRYEIEAGAARTARREVAVRLLPKIVGVTVTYTYPSYTRLKPKSERIAGRTVTALEGTKINLEIECSIPMKSVTGEVEGERRVFRLDRKNPHKASLYQIVNRNEQMGVTLTAENGLVNLRELPFNLRAVTDNPPMISAKGGWGDQAVLSSEVIQIAYKAQDDIGLSEVVLVGPGKFAQDVTLESYGAREAEGVLSVPVAAFMPKDGSTAVRLRMTAQDTKGQLASSAPLIVYIAFNSYDRQCRTVRNILTGGLNVLQRQERKQNAVRDTLNRLTMLKGTVQETGGIPENMRRTAEDARGWLRFLLADVNQGYQPAYAEVAQATLTPRLLDMAAEAAWGAEAALDAAPLLAAWERYLATDNAKAETEAMTAMMTEAQQVVEGSVARLHDINTMVETELLGYLMSSLVRDIRRADALRFSEREFLITRMATFREIADLATRPSMPWASNDVTRALVTLSTQDDRAAALRSAAEPMEDLLAVVTQEAVRLATGVVSGQWSVVSTENNAVGNAPSLTTDHWPLTTDLRRRFVEGSALALKSRGLGGDELGMMERVMHYLGGLSGQWSVVSGQQDNGGMEAFDLQPSTFNLQTSTFELYATAERWRTTAQALRVGLATGACLPGTPDGDARWITLRELRFDMMRLAAALPEGDSRRLAIEALTAQAAPLAAWMMPFDVPPMTLAREITSWEAQATALADGLRASALEELRRANDTLQAQWKERILEGLRHYLRFANGMPQSVLSYSTAYYYDQEYDSLEAIQWLQFLHNAAQQYVGLRATHEMMHARNPSECADVKEAIAFQTILRAMQKDVKTRITRDARNAAFTIISKEPDKLKEAVMATADDARRERWLENGAIAADVEALLVAAWHETAWEELLARHDVRHRYHAELKEMERVLTWRDTASPSLMQEIKGDRLRSAALWGEWAYTVAHIGDIADDEKKTLLKHLEAVGTLPREVTALAACIAGTASSDDCAGVQRELAEMARIAPAAKTDAALADAAVVLQRAQLALLAGAVPADTLHWAMSEYEWIRRKLTSDESNVGVGTIAVMGDGDLDNLKLPRHLYQELKRAREGAMPDFFKDRAYFYLNTLMEKAR
ncbi:MAG: hypothetical protein FWF84_01335 [Kiritimatiellaeota bacterium]|nr:hypothetical protein [Kiritimatiellota bacterium]